MSDVAFFDLMPFLPRLLNNSLNITSIPDNYVRSSPTPGAFAGLTGIGDQCERGGLIGLVFKLGLSDFSLVSKHQKVSVL